MFSSPADTAKVSKSKAKWMSTAKRVRMNHERLVMNERMEALNTAVVASASGVQQLNPEKRFHVIEHFSHFSPTKKTALVDILENVDESISAQLQQWLRLATHDDQTYFLELLSSVPILHQQRCIQLFHRMVNFEGSGALPVTKTLLGSHPKIQLENKIQSEASKTKVLSEIVRIFSNLKVSFLSPFSSPHVSFSPALFPSLSSLLILVPS
jgi:hypothetical protein